MAVTPTLGITDLGSMRLSFYMLTSAAVTRYDRLIVGMTNQLDSLTLNSYLPLDTICISEDQPDPMTKTWYNYQYDLAVLDTLTDKESYQYVVFVMEYDLNRSSSTATTGTSANLYVDDLQVAPIPTCETPMDVKASNYKKMHLH